MVGMEETLVGLDFTVGASLSERLRGDGRSSEDIGNSTNKAAAAARMKLATEIEVKSIKNEKTLNVFFSRPPRTQTKMTIGWIK